MKFDATLEATAAATEDVTEEPLNKGAATAIPNNEGIQGIIIPQIAPVDKLL